MKYEAEYREKARRFIALTCGNTPLPHGQEFRKAIGDPIYERVTEGRQQAALEFNVRNAEAISEGKVKREFYSSCGDPAHALFECLGARLGWINRKALGHYRNGWNVSALIESGLTRRPHIGDFFDAGDVIIVNEADPGTTHVHVFYRCVTDAIWQTGNFGQPGTALRQFEPSEIPSKTDPGRFRLGARAADRALSLIDVLKAADKMGLLCNPADPDDWLAGMP